MARASLYHDETVSYRGLRGQVGESGSVRWPAVLPEGNSLPFAQACGRKSDHAVASAAPSRPHLEVESQAVASARWKPDPVQVSANTLDDLGFIWFDRGWNGMNIARRRDLQAEVEHDSLMSVREGRGVVAVRAELPNGRERLVGLGRCKRRRGGSARAAAAEQSCA